MLDKIKGILREKEMPMFSDEEIQSYIDSGKSENEILYELLIRKSENTAISISGLTTADTSAYFKRLASTYRPFNTGNIGGKQ